MFLWNKGFLYFFESIYFPLDSIYFFCTCCISCEPAIIEINGDSFSSFITEDSSMRRGGTVDDFEFELIFYECSLCELSEYCCIFTIEITNLFEDFLKCTDFWMYLLEFCGWYFFENIDELELFLFS